MLIMKKWNEKWVWFFCQRILSLCLVENARLIILFHESFPFLLIIMTETYCENKARITGNPFHKRLKLF